MQSVEAARLSGEELTAGAPVTAAYGVPAERGGSVAALFSIAFECKFEKLI